MLLRINVNNYIWVFYSQSRIHLKIHVESIRVGQCLNISLAQLKHMAVKSSGPLMPVKGYSQHIKMHHMHVAGVYKTSKRCRLVDNMLDAGRAC